MFAYYILIFMKWLYIRSMLKKSSSGTNFLFNVYSLSELNRTHEQDSDIVSLPTHRQRKKYSMWM